MIFVSKKSISTINDYMKRPNCYNGLNFNIIWALGNKIRSMHSFSGQPDQVAHMDCPKYTKDSVL